MHTSTNDILHGNMGTHHPSKEQASSRTNKDGKEYVKHHIQGQNKIWVREKTKVTDVIEKARRRKWTWAGHVSRIRDNRWTLCITIWKPYESKRPRGKPSKHQRQTRRLMEGYHLAEDKDRQMWKQHAEAFATGHYRCTMMMTVFSTVSSLYKRPLINDHPANATSHHGNLTFTPDERPSDRWRAHFKT